MDKVKIIIDSLLEDEGDDTGFGDVEHVETEEDKFDTWVNKYRPVKNHLNPGAPFDGTMFETYERELAHVERQDQHHVWTYVTGDENQDIITAGFHFVNRQGYFITEVPWTDETESFEFGEGDPETPLQMAWDTIENQLGRDWKADWGSKSDAEKLAAVMANLDILGSEMDAGEIVTIINNLSV